MNIKSSIMGLAFMSQGLTALIYAQESKQKHLDSGTVVVEVTDTRKQPEQYTVQYEEYQPPQTLNIPQFPDSTHLEKIPLDETILKQFSIPKKTANMYTDNENIIYVTYTKGKNAKGKNTNKPTEHHTVLQIKKTPKNTYIEHKLEEQMDFFHIFEDAYVQGIYTQFKYDDQTPSNKPRLLGKDVSYYGVGFTFDDRIRPYKGLPPNNKNHRKSIQTRSILNK